MTTKTPPFLLGATLVFWGWQTGFLIPGAIMGAVLEGARFVKARWEVSDEDFSRIWTFCALSFFAGMVYAFTANDGPANFRNLFQDHTLSAQTLATTSGARAAITMIRWFPMAFFLFIAAQTYSTRGVIPFEMISFFLRRQMKMAVKAGQPLPKSRLVDVSYPYFVVCLFAASAHTGGGNTFFWGVCVLVIWALWARRSTRFGALAWLGALALVIVPGYLAQLGITQLQRIVANYNPDWLSNASRGGFDPTQSRTEIGQIGRIKTSGSIVIRIQPKTSGSPPNYLRAASYRNYWGASWYAGSSKDDFINVQSQTNNTTWVLQPGRTNYPVTVNLACYLSGGRALLPLPTGSGQLDNLAAFFLEKNSAGTVVATGPGLVIFDAKYGPGSTIDSAPVQRFGTNEDLDVPAREAPALDQVIADLRLAGQSQSQALRTINGFFQGQFAYSLWQQRVDLVNTNETPLGRFLLRTRSGHCEYFASATVLLLRKLGIPARYAVGYAVHEASGSGYVVRQRDAHAWCLVWDDTDKTWHDFDTTPASWVAEENRHASPLQFISDTWSWVSFQFSKFRWGQTHLRQYILLSLIPVLAILLYQIIFRKGRVRLRKHSSGATTTLAWPGLDSEFYQLETHLAARCGPRPAGEPLSAWLQRAAADPHLAASRVPLLELLRLHYRYRFDPHGLDQTDREMLRTQVRLCLAPIQ